MAAGVNVSMGQTKHKFPAIPRIWVLREALSLENFLKIQPIFFDLDMYVRWWIRILLFFCFRFLALFPGPGLLMNQNVQTHQPSVLEVVSWLGLCSRDASETDSLVFVDDVTHDGSSRMNYKSTERFWRPVHRKLRPMPKLQNWPSKSPHPRPIYLPRKRLRSETPKTKETTARSLESQQKSRSRQFLDATRLLAGRWNKKCDQILSVIHFKTACSNNSAQVPCYKRCRVLCCLTRPKVERSGNWMIWSQTQLSSTCSRSETVGLFHSHAFLEERNRAVR